jgi:hypothetical protein
MDLYLHSPLTPSWRGAQLKHRDTISHISLKTSTNEKKLTTFLLRKVVNGCQHTNVVILMNMLLFLLIGARKVRRFH